jgi:hypothetical protein
LRQSSEAAHLLDDGGVQTRRRRLSAWEATSASSSCEGEAPSPTSSSSSEGAAGDVRLRSLHGRSAAGSTAAVQQWQQCRAEDADDVLLVEDMEDYGPYEVLASCSASAAAAEPAAPSTATASLQPRLLGSAVCAGTAEAFAQTLPPLRNRAGLLGQPPGSSWSLGGSPCLDVGGSVCSTFSSTSHTPLAGSELAGSAPARHTYYERLTSSRTHVGLEASGQVISSSSSGGSTLLGPGTHLISQQALCQQSSSSSCFSMTHSRTAGADRIDDPVAQLEQLHRDKARRLRQHQLQLSQAADSDGNESPPELSVRLAQKRQQQLTAAGSAEPVTAAAAGAAASKTCGKKKKGRSKAAAGHAGERAAASEASAAAAAAAERRRERDHLECAMYDRGSGSGSSHGDSEVSGRVSAMPASSRATASMSATVVYVQHTACHPSGCS